MQNETLITIIDVKNYIFNFYVNMHVTNDREKNESFESIFWSNTPDNNDLCVCDSVLVLTFLLFIVLSAFNFCFRCFNFNKRFQGNYWILNDQLFTFGESWNMKGLCKFMRRTMNSSWTIIDYIWTCDTFLRKSLLRWL